MVPEAQQEIHFQNFPQLKTVPQLGIDNLRIESIAIHNHYEDFVLDNLEAASKWPTCRTSQPSA